MTDRKSKLAAFGAIATKALKSEAATVESRRETATKPRSGRSEEPIDKNQDQSISPTPQQSTTLEVAVHPEVSPNTTITADMASGHEAPKRKTLSVSRTRGGDRVSDKHPPAPPTQSSDQAQIAVEEEPQPQVTEADRKEKRFLPFLKRPGFDPCQFHPNWLADQQALLMEALEITDVKDLPLLFQQTRAFPMARKIQDAIAERYGSKCNTKLVSKFLRQMSGSLAYQRGVEREAMRYDLDMQPVEEVTDNDRRYALMKIDQHIAARKARRLRRDAAIAQAAK